MQTIDIRISGCLWARALTKYASSYQITNENVDKKPVIRRRLYQRDEHAPIAVTFTDVSQKSSRG